MNPSVLVQGPSEHSSEVAAAAQPEEEANGEADSQGEEIGQPLVADTEAAAPEAEEPHKEATLEV